MNNKLFEAILLISSKRPDNHAFGTGFVIRRDQDATYLLTCAHVIDEVGGSNEIEVESLAATIVSSGSSDGADWAVLRVNGLWDKPLLDTRISGEEGMSFVAAGFQSYGPNLLLRPIQGVLHGPVQLQPRKQSSRSEAWDLEITDRYFLRPGYSGAPVVDDKSNNVVGMVVYGTYEGKDGLALSLEFINGISWKVPSTPSPPDAALFWDLKQRLDRLSHDFRRCEQALIKSNISGRLPNHAEIGAVIVTWNDSQRAFIETRSLASRIVLPGSIWEGFFTKLDDAHRYLDESIRDMALARIAERMTAFRRALDNLEAAVAIELNYSIRPSQPPAI